MGIHHLFANVILLCAAAGCASAAATAESAPPEAPGFGCMMKSMMCSAWKDVDPALVQQAKQKCSSDAGQVVDECPAEGRVATCSGATSPSGNPMPDVHFYGGGAAPDAEGMGVVADKICKESGGTLSTTTSAAP